MMKRFLSMFILAALTGCSDSYDPRNTLSDAEYDALLLRIAPYVVKKPDEFSYEERFDKKNQAFYKDFITKTGAKIERYLKTDTATLFFFTHRDYTSLYEHYRGLGGYFKGSNDSITFINLLYHTPRFTKDEMEEKGKTLFDEMVSTGNVKQYIGNRKYIHTPNADIYYNTKLNRWEYTENSSWKFLEDARKEADKNSYHSADSTH